MMLKLKLQYFGHLTVGMGADGKVKIPTQAGVRPTGDGKGKNQEKRGVAGLLLGRTERAARAAELQLCAQAR